MAEVPTLIRDVCDARKRLVGTAGSDVTNMTDDRKRKHDDSDADCAS